MDQNKRNHGSKKMQRIKYILFDVVAVLLAWALFFLFRRIEIESNVVREIQLFSPIYNFEKLIIGIPFFWLFIFWVSGYYNKPFLKSRLHEFAQTFLSTLIGCTILFFLLLLNDPVVNYKDYYLSFIVLFLIYFSVVYLFRYMITRKTTERIHNRTIGFNTIIIGTGEKAKQIYGQLQSMKLSSGNFINGFVSCEEHMVIDGSLILGDISQLNDIIEANQIEEVIIALDNNDRNALLPIFNILYHHDVTVKVAPQLYDYLIGGVRMTSIFGAPLVSALDVRLNEFEKNVKRLFDILFSCFVIILVSPFCMILSLLIKLTSDGPVFYKQERVGLHGKLFHILKFRTMVSDAEASGPQLASSDDQRITKIGRILRRFRIDELPQFINVLKGDMSIVGPRPERPYYEEQIAQKVPYYGIVHKVKPGITSWGMVKYGYATDVDKMVERLKYDIIYLENISLLVDLKILIYTVKTVVSGRGM
ncbi:MAG: sugar transferase [Paludibacteraceae bacterium]|nr:sugar transferase [Paludibacteraceae bacterium]